MNYFLLIVEAVSGAGVLLGVIGTVWVQFKRIIEGQRCQLRSDMLSTYYKHREEKVIRQYELENFLLLYSAYKSLKGNSFIDKIHSEVIEWEVDT